MKLSTLSAYGIAVANSLPFKPTPANFARLAVVGVIVAGVAGTFAFAGGWFSPSKLTAGKIVDAFEQTAGKHESFRRNHAKGVGVSGYFESNGSGVRVSKAVVFSDGKTPVIGRFALGGGMPFQPDKPDTVRSMALKFLLSDGEEWRMGINNIPVFVAQTPADFRDLLIATAPDPTTHQPDPAKAGAFFQSHPASAKAIGILKSGKPTAGFDDATYCSLNAFIFTNADGKKTPVRWAMVPVDPPPPPATQPAGDNALFDALIAAVHDRPMKWKLILTLGQPGDSTVDSTIPWPADREKVEAGTLTIDHVEAEETSDARTTNFDPLVLPNGIAGSDDPILAARSAAYSQSYTRRAGETVQPSAVTPKEVIEGTK